VFYVGYRLMRPKGSSRYYNTRVPRFLVLDWVPRQSIAPEGEFNTCAYVLRFSISGGSMVVAFCLATRSPSSDLAARTGPLLMVKQIQG